MVVSAKAQWHSHRALVYHSHREQLLAILLYQSLLSTSEPWQTLYSCKVEGKVNKVQGCWCNQDPKYIGYALYV